ncbi:MAG TPA: outer membrane beta-barrel protein [Flavobacteriales bacterium]
MKSRIIVAAMAFVGCGMAMAQENRFSAGLEIALPMGDFGDASGIGLGATLGYEIPVADKIGFVAQLGYINFMAKDIEVLGTTVEGSSVGMIPIQVGAKYYFSDNQEGAYLGLLTGVHMAMVKVPTYDLSTGAVSEETETDTNFGIAPMFGFMVTENIDIALRYQMIFAKSAEVTGFTVEEKTVTNSYLGVRAAYMFGGR